MHKVTSSGPSRKIRPMSFTKEPTVNNLNTSPTGRSGDFQARSHAANKKSGVRLLHSAPLKSQLLVPDAWLGHHDSNKYEKQGKCRR